VPVEVIFQRLFGAAHESASSSDPNHPRRDQMESG